MKRPAGVLLASIVLGLFAALQLLAAALYILAIVTRHGLPGQPAQPGLPTGAYLTFIMAFVSIFFAILATWAIFTLVGILRLPNWARYSILVIGGCLATLGTLSVFGSIVASAFLPPSPAAAGLPPHTMGTIFLFMGLMYSAIAAIGFWWLVYFNLRSIKIVFLPRHAAAPPPAWGSSESLNLDTWDGTPPTPLPGRLTGRFAHVPISIIVIACLFLLGALLCAAISPLPFPAFLFGFMLYRPASTLVYAAFALAAGLIGVGLLRLDNRARLGVYAFSAVGIVNFAALLTPGGQARYAAYQQSIFSTMQAPGMPPMHVVDTHVILLFSAVFTLLFYGVQIWLIEHHRAAFLPPPVSH